MILLKRLVTAAVLLVILFVGAYLTICIVGGAITGGMAGAGTANSQDSYEAGRQAGEGFVADHLRTISLGSLVFALATSVALSFSNIFPWCRKASR